jgi:anti-sigma-K factor RskA
MTHAEMDELYELYALGALEVELAAQIDEHVATQCQYCLEHIREAVNATAMLSGLSDSLEAPSNVRERLLAGLRPRKSARRWSFAVPVLALACAALLVFGIWSTNQLSGIRSELDRVVGERDQLRSAVEILTKSETRTVRFGQSDQVAHGRVFVNKSGGFVFVGSELPKIAADKTFELWLVPAKGAPAPAGLVRANAAGDFVHVSQTPVDVSRIAAIAVSVEPRAGSAAPTTKPFIIVPLG